MIVVAPIAPAFQAIAPSCAAQGGDSLAPAPALNGAADTPAARAERRLPLDVVVQTAAQIDRMLADGSLVASSKADLGSSRLGMAIRQGAPKPDISTPEGVRQAMLNAKSFGYSAFASGVYLTTDVLPKLGVWDQVKDRGRVIRGEPVGAALARGDIEIGFQQVPELQAVGGIQLVGPLPASLQQVTIYSAAVATASAAPQDARAFVVCLAAAAARFQAAGFDPVPR